MNANRIDCIANGSNCFRKWTKSHLFEMPMAKYFFQARFIYSNFVFKLNKENKKWTIFFIACLHAIQS